MPSLGSVISDDALEATATASCKKYMVRSGDTCSSIGKSTGATWAQLISWNSEINNQCSYVTILSYVWKWYPRLIKLSLETLIKSWGKIYVLATQWATISCLQTPSVAQAQPALGMWSLPLREYSHTANTKSGSWFWPSSYQSHPFADTPWHKLSLRQTPQDWSQRELRHGGKEVRNLKVWLVSFGCALRVREIIDLNVLDSLFLNPEVFTNCTNLQKNVYYCVKPVGYIPTYPSYGGSATSTPVLSPISMTDAPFPTHLLDSGGDADAVIPVANDSRKDCTE